MHEPYVSSGKNCTSTISATCSPSVKALLEWPTVIWQQTLDREWDKRQGRSARDASALRCRSKLLALLRRATAGPGPPPPTGGRSKKASRTKRGEDEEAGGASGSGGDVRVRRRAARLALLHVGPGRDAVHPPAYRTTTVYGGTARSFGRDGGGAAHRPNRTDGDGPSTDDRNIVLFYADDWTLGIFNDKVRTPHSLGRHGPPRGWPSRTTASRPAWAGGRAPPR
jgi:hypothetical protein